ncbi:hypothetical protein J2T47_003274 [Pseudomonas nitroreducens]|nr:hypothetical protein [Pseudomonas nitroreducens]
MQAKATLYGVGRASSNGGAFVAGITRSYRHAGCCAGAAKDFAEKPRSYESDAGLTL